MAIEYRAAIDTCRKAVESVRAVSSSTSAGVTFTRGRCL
jgi:hypothetical protein